MIDRYVNIYIVYSQIYIDRQIDSIQKDVVICINTKIDRQIIPPWHSPGCSEAVQPLGPRPAAAVAGDDRAPARGPEPRHLRSWSLSDVRQIVICHITIIQKKMCCANTNTYSLTDRHYRQIKMNSLYKDRNRMILCV